MREKSIKPKNKLTEFLLYQIKALSYILKYKNGGNFDHIIEMFHQLIFSLLTLGSLLFLVVVSSYIISIVKFHFIS